MHTGAKLLSQPPAQVHQTGAELLAQAVCDHEDAIAQRERARWYQPVLGTRVPRSLLRSSKPMSTALRLKSFKRPSGLKPMRESLWRGLSDTENAWR